jgi:hypothetical protein
MCRPRLCKSGANRREPPLKTRASAVRLPCLKLREHLMADRTWPETRKRSGDRCCWRIPPYPDPFPHARRREGEPAVFFPSFPVGEGPRMGVNRFANNTVIAFRPSRPLSCHPPDVPRTAGSSAARPLRAVCDRRAGRAVSGRGRRSPPGRPADHRRTKAAPPA